jgi:hypothetical protein
MKALFKFDLADPDDNEEFLRLVKATNMASVIWELVYNSRKTIEHIIAEKKDVSPYDAVDMFYDRLHELLKENDINIDQIYR